MTKQENKILSYPVPNVIVRTEQAKVIPLAGGQKAKLQEQTYQVKVVMPVEPVGYMRVKKHEHF